MNRILTEYTEQASVSNWPARISLVLVLVALICVAVWGMRRGWLARQTRQADIPPPMESGTSGYDVWQAVEPGVFIGTSRAGDWLDRIAVHDLGIRSRATCHIGEGGVWLEREAARSVFIPASHVKRIRTDRGVAGTVRSADSVIVFTWQLGDALIESGFRADSGPSQRTLLDSAVSLGYLVDIADSAGAAGGER